MTLRNEERAARYETSIESYMDADPYSNLVDFLTDAMHWCHLNERCSFDAALEAALMHFRVEASSDAS
jgi:hypothetical protein